MLAFVLAASLVAGSVQAPQQAASSSTSAQPQSSEQATVTADDLPVSIERIQRALAEPNPIQLKEQHPVFRLEIFGKKPTIEDVLGEKFWIGPVPYGS